MGLMFYLQVQPHFHTTPYLLYLQLVIFWHEYVKRQMWATFYYYFLATYKYIHLHIQKKLTSSVISPMHCTKSPFKGITVCSSVLISTSIPSWLIIPIFLFPSFQLKNNYRYTKRKKKKEKKR